jgi:hypothetical protein
VSERLDLDRISDWSDAVDRWQRGDARALAAFVLRYGVHTDDERHTLARMLTTKPDARRGAKSHTVAALRDVDRMISRSARDKSHIQDWAARLRIKLVARGWTAAQIAQALGRRHYLHPKGPTNDDIFAAVAALHGMEAEAVEKAHKRHR